jgi:hypothetical protein
VTKGSEMTKEQNETIELMKRLGSNGNTRIDGGSVYVALPFRTDHDPNVKVWRDGSWRDFSSPTETASKWAELGLSDHGTLQQLRDSLTDRFPKLWKELPDAYSFASTAAYITSRQLRGDIRVAQDSLCFPIYNKHMDMVGIQTRRIDGGTPKNQMLHGSDGKHGLFVSFLDGPNQPLVICEGATDTYTVVGTGWSMIGAVSCSMLDGVKEYLLQNKDNYPCFVLALDADEPGRAAQGELLSYMLSIGIHRTTILFMTHSDGCKDLNDEILKNGTIHTEALPAQGSSIFVKVVGEIVPEMENALWVGFFPPDFPGFEHATNADGRHQLYVFPESYPRGLVNARMWYYRQSAYILRGF